LPRMSRLTYVPLFHNALPLYFVAHSTHAVMPGSGPLTIGAVLAVYGLGIYFVSGSLSTNKQAVFLLPISVLTQAIRPAATGTDSAMIWGSTLFLCAM
jgi:hypothetical protein